MSYRFRSSFSIQISSGSKLSWLMCCLSQLEPDTTVLFLLANSLSYSQVTKVSLVLKYPVNNCM